LATVGVRAHLDELRFPPNDRLFETEPDVKIRVISQKPQDAFRGHLVLIHGLEGSSEGSYMRSLAQCALVNGLAAHRMNMRNCGGTEAHCRTLYHAGLTIDIERFVEHLQATEPGPIYLVGFSLGGNQVSKLAGVRGAQGREVLAGVAAVSAPIDLAECARCIQSRENWLYQWQFVERMRKTIKRKHALMPDLYTLNGIDRIRTIIEIDDVYIAPLGGFRDAAHYYATQSAQNFFSSVQVPMLLVHAADDPFIPVSLYDQPAISDNPWIHFVRAPHGGHMGFLARKRPHFWLNEVLMRWIQTIESGELGSPSIAAAANTREF